MLDNVANKNTFSKTSVSSNDSDSNEDRIIINVGGMRFETHKATLQNIGDTRLAWLTENLDPNSTKEHDWFFDRHPGAFVYILNFYRTGKLHTPADMCGPAFEEELAFWGIDEKQMEPCCWENFTRHREAEENLKSFEGPGFDDLRDERRKSIARKRNHNSCLSHYYDIMWKILDDPHSHKGAKIFSLLSCFMIILSVSGYCLSTMPDLHDYIPLLHDINVVCVVFFTVECVLRFITCPNRKKFLLDLSNWIDFISVIPSYMVIVFPSENWVKNLVIIRLLRVFKFFKLSYGLQVLVHTLKASSYELSLLLLMLLIPVVIFSSIVYAVESNLNKANKFDSIPKTFWWCVITMTTVGYGDLVPNTWPGKLIGTLCAIFGLLTVALPISVIGGNFSLYYAHVRARLKLPKKNRRNLQVNMHGLLRQTTSLSSRDRDRKLLRRKPPKVESKRFLDKFFHKSTPNQDNKLNRFGGDDSSPDQSTRHQRRTAILEIDATPEEVGGGVEIGGGKGGVASNMFPHDARPRPDPRTRNRRRAIVDLEGTDEEGNSSGEELRSMGSESRNHLSDNGSCLSNGEDRKLENTSYPLERSATEDQPDSFPVALSDQGGKGRGEGEGRSELVNGSHGSLDAESLSATEDPSLTPNNTSNRYRTQLSNRQSVDTVATLLSDGFGIGDGIDSLSSPPTQNRSYNSPSTEKHSYNLTHENNIGKPTIRSPDMNILDSDKSSDTNKDDPPSPVQKPRTKKMSVCKEGLVKMRKKSAWDDTALLLQQADAAEEENSVGSLFTLRRSRKTSKACDVTKAPCDFAKNFEGSRDNDVMSSVICETEERRTSNVDDERGGLWMSKRHDTDWNIIHEEQHNGDDDASSNINSDNNSNDNSATNSTNNSNSSNNISNTNSNSRKMSRKKSRKYTTASSGMENDKYDNNVNRTNREPCFPSRSKSFPDSQFMQITETESMTPLHSTTNTANQSLTNNDSNCSISKNKNTNSSQNNSINNINNDNDNNNSNNNNNNNNSNSNNNKSISNNNNTNNNNNDDTLPDLQRPLRKASLAVDTYRTRINRVSSSVNYHDLLNKQCNDIIVPPRRPLRKLTQQMPSRLHSDGDLVNNRARRMRKESIV